MIEKQFTYYLRYPEKDLRGNPGRKKVKKLYTSILFMLLILAVAQAEVTFLDDLNQAQRYELSQAYLAVSQRYEELGDDQRAQGYKDVSDAILATLNEGPSVEDIQTVETTTVEQIPQEEREVEQRTQQAIMYFFNKLASSLSAESVERCIAMMSFPLDIAGYEIDEAAVRADLEELTAAYDLTVYSADDIWILDTAEFYYEGDAVILSINTAIPDPGVFLFWNDPQEFIYVQGERGWKLAGIR
jgi:hypothetical protein